VVFRFTPLAAPVKCSVFALMAQAIFQPAVQRLAQALTRAGISRKVDDSGASIGKRYARTDEIGVPFAITVDHTTLADDTVTLRERDSMLQVTPCASAALAATARAFCATPLHWQATAEAVCTLAGAHPGRRGDEGGEGSVRHGHHVGSRRLPQVPSPGGGGRQAVMHLH
jgi:hypothetical protein